MRKSAILITVLVLMTALASTQGPPMPGEDIEESSADSNQTVEDGNTTNESTANEGQPEEESSSVIQTIIRILSVF